MATLFFTEAVPLYVPTNNAPGFLSFSSRPYFLFLFLFLIVAIAIDMGCTCYFIIRRSGKTLVPEHECLLLPTPSVVHRPAAWTPPGCWGSQNFSLHPSHTESDYILTRSQVSLTIIIILSIAGLWRVRDSEEHELHLDSMLKMRCCWIKQVGVFLLLIDVWYIRSLKETN